MGQNRGKSHRIFTPNKLDLTLRALNHCAKFHQNRIKIAVVGVFIYRQTDRMTEVILKCYAIAMGQIISASGPMKRRLAGRRTCSKAFPIMESCLVDVESRMEIECCSLPRTVRRFSAIHVSSVLRGTCFKIQLFAKSTLAFRKLSASSHVPPNSAYSMFSVIAPLKC